MIVAQCTRVLPSLIPRLLLDGGERAWLPLYTLTRNTCNYDYFVGGTQMCYDLVYVCIIQ